MRSWDRTSSPLRYCRQVLCVPKSRLVWRGVALLVIFISGSINTTVACRFIHGRVYQDSVICYVNTAKGWITWLAIVALITIVAWIIAEAIGLILSTSPILQAFAFYKPIP